MDTIKRSGKREPIDHVVVALPHPRREAADDVNVRSRPRLCAIQNGRARYGQARHDVRRATAASASGAALIATPGKETLEVRRSAALGVRFRASTRRI